MTWVSQALAVGLGAATGAWLRWGLALALNQASPRLPLGTLAANWIGGFAVGVALAHLAARPGLSAEWRLFVMTGLLGGLTTFSTFSGEVVTLMQKNDMGAAFLLAALHLAGSLALTALGFAAYRHFSA
jgi:CrcB protein